MNAKNHHFGNGRANSYATHRTPAGANASANANANTNAIDIPSRSIPRSHTDETLSSSGLQSTLSHAQDESTMDSSVSSMMFSKYLPEDEEEEFSPRQSVTSDGAGDESLTRVSSGSSIESNLQHGTRYKLTMKLSARDITLIRESWSILLDDECPPEKLKSFVSKLQAGRNMGLAEPTNNRHNRRAGHPTMGMNRSQAGAGAGGPAAAPNPAKDSERVRSTSGKKSSNSLFGDQFLENIMALAPELQTLFPMIKHIAVGVTGVLTIAVNNLEDLSVLDTYMAGLGKRHARILGVQAGQFEFAGAAFMQTVRERFGVSCTLELEETWRRMYSFLANSLLQFGIDPTLETPESSSRSSSRAEQVIYMEPPELLSRSGTLGAQKANPPTVPPKPVQKSLLDPVAMSRDHRLSTASGIQGANKLPPRRTAQSGFNSRKNGEKDCVIM
ncbi:LANO_0F00298g1_1 [Lachancea nothofagi CBS 11611]|uniref:LANO_0F00298g1_1 n=1 Tax=Lachancea nothofagi CBS 11611 TaxID=1266666 RepID=A0A1G4K571_9SACH|nr:LANO_0F00298g1_1 [Lachancea nothofagi CBS 11611]